MTTYEERLSPAYDKCRKELLETGKYREIVSEIYGPPGTDFEDLIDDMPLLRRRLASYNMTADQSRPGGYIHITQLDLNKPVPSNWRSVADMIAFGETNVEAKQGRKPWEPSSTAPVPRGITAWSRAKAEEIVADGRPVGGYFQMEEEVRQERAIAKALRLAYLKGLISYV